MTYLRDITIPPGHELISYDVTSMYTNIPVDTAIQILHEKWHIIEPHTPLKESQFIDATNLCLNNTIFSFNQQTYKQIHGLAMGSPLSAPIANITLETLETHALNSITYPMQIYKRYVDDIIAAPPKDKQDHFKTTLEQFNPNITFTQETEDNNNSITFLDTRLQRINNGKLRISHYRKPTHNGKHLDFYSTNPKSHKLATMKALLIKAHKIPNNKEDHTDAINNTIQTLKQNNYPTKLIQETLNHIQNPKQTQPPQSTIQPTKQIYCTIPYYPKLSETIARILWPLNIKCSHRPIHKILQSTPLHLKTKFQ